jgi:16S rRNA (adenine(1408)-N(1))-methyltransferase
MKIVLGKKLDDMPADAFAGLVAAHDRVLVDLGTGNGRFVLGAAREDPARLCIGIDAVHEAMRETAAQARRKPARGGAPNALFVVAAAEALPEALTGIADEITINYPWGSLMRMVVAPDEAALARIAALGKPGATVTILLTWSVFEDPDYLRRLDMPPLGAADVETRLAPVYARAGIRIDRHGIVGADEIPHRTRWGRRLTAGSGRTTYLIAGTVAPPE